MKGTLLFQLLAVVLMLATFSPELSAQNMPKKYASLEHFTNTPCPSCGSQNPGFFDLLEGYSGNYHHISYHPGQPYQSCIFYQENTTENRARSNYYSISSSPRVVINGLTQSSSGTVTANMLNDVTGGESPIEVQVEETSGINRTVSVDINLYGTAPVTNAKLYAAVVEKEIMYNAPNGETVHHNVFRKFLTSSDGNDIDLSNSTSGISFNYNITSPWNADEIYTVVWVQDPVTKEVLNSGTPFDPPFVSAIEAPKTVSFAILPNPVEDLLEIQMENPDQINTIRIHDMSGKQLFYQTGILNSSINVRSLNPGLYIIELVTNNGELLKRKFVKTELE
jgi:hypothetical protein